jgi:hypothetical protein
MRIEGACHCGNLAFVLETEASRNAIAPRACACDFCRSHAAKCWSDPKGRVRITVRDEALLQRYRFALGTADFLVCGRCGAYAGAMIGAGAEARATVNLRLTSLDGLPAAEVSYAGETRAERIARRLERWTPTSIVIESAT